MKCGLALSNTCQTKGFFRSPAALLVHRLKPVATTFVEMCQILKMDSFSSTFQKEKKLATKNQIQELMDERR